MVFTLAQSKHQTQQNKKQYSSLADPSFSRIEATMTNRLRIGHTQLTHSYLITKQDPQSYEICGIILNSSNTSSLNTTNKEITENNLTSPSKRSKHWDQKFWIIRT